MLWDQLHLDSEAAHWLCRQAALLCVPRWVFIINSLFGAAFLATDLIAALAAPCTPIVAKQLTVVVSRGHFPFQATTDEHRVPVPHLPTLAGLPGARHPALGSFYPPWRSPTAPLDEALQHFSPGCPEPASMAPQPTGGSGTPSCPCGIGQMVLVWCANQMSASPPCSASSARCGGRRKGCGVRGLDAGLHLGAHGMQTVDDKMLEAGAGAEQHLCATVQRH